LGVLGISYLGPWIAKYAVKFGPPEYFGLLLFGLTMLISLAGASVFKGLVAGVVGVFLAMMGTDPLTGVARLDFGVLSFRKGLDMVPVLVGLFGIGEILSAAEQGRSRIFTGELGKKWMPRGAELKRGLWASLRGSVLGFVAGLLPGMNPILTSFFSYDFEKRISKHPEKFGTGLIEGVACPEAANNATAMAGFIPMMSLGIPTSASTAIIMACLVLHGLQPGPLLFVQQKDFFWTVIGSMYIGNVMLLILNLPLVGLWARISLIPYKILGPIILAICFIAAYSSRNNFFDIGVAIVFGALGYFMRHRQWPIAPLILGFILGDLFEGALRQSLAMGIGSPIIFLKRPIALTFIMLTIITLVLTVRFLKRVPKVLLEEEP
jgi:putative tricarboxylic transport membrane protein